LWIPTALARIVQEDGEDCEGAIFEGGFPATCFRIRPKKKLIRKRLEAGVIKDGGEETPAKARKVE
jgi:hypothetical protein